MVNWYDLYTGILRSCRNISLSQLLTTPKLNYPAAGPGTSTNTVTAYKYLLHFDLSSAPHILKLYTAPAQAEPVYLISERRLGARIDVTMRQNITETQRR